MFLSQFYFLYFNEIVLLIYIIYCSFWFHFNVTKIVLLCNMRCTFLLILHLNVFYIEIFIVVKKIFIVYVYLILLPNWYYDVIVRLF